MDFAALLPIPPLPELMKDPEITEIMINGPDRIFIERDGKRIPTDLRFEDITRLRYAVERLLEANPGSRLDHNQPMVDLALPDGSRVNIVIPPVVIGGPHLTIRRYNRPVRYSKDLVEVGTLGPRAAWFLDRAVRHGAAALYSGATGTGKTTMLEVFARSINPRERIVVIEDALELHLYQPDVVRMLGRRPNIEGAGEITLGDLFRNSLRMRPSRILLGEIRGREVLDYLQAITSGHRGSQAIIHAATPREAVIRMQQLAVQAGRGASREVTCQQILDGLDLIVQLEIHPDGVRRTTQVSEVVDDPEAPDGIGLVDIYRWRPGAGGGYEVTGYVPRFAEELALVGETIPEDTFEAGPDI